MTTTSHPKLAISAGAERAIESADARWLIEEIVFRNQTIEWLPAEFIQVWTLTRKEGSRRATLTLQGSSGDKILDTTFYGGACSPCDLTLWVEHGVIYLPDER